MNRQEALDKNKTKISNFGNKPKKKVVNSTYIDKVNSLSVDKPCTSPSLIQKDNDIFELNQKITKLEGNIQELKETLISKNETLKSLKSNTKKTSDMKVSNLLFKIMDFPSPARRVFKALYTEVGSFNIKQELSKNKCLQKHNFSFAEWKNGITYLIDNNIVELNTFKPEKGRHKTTCILILK